MSVICWEIRNVNILNLQVSKMQSKVTREDYTVIHSKKSFALMEVILNAIINNCYLKKSKMILYFFIKYINFKILNITIFFCILFLCSQMEISNFAF